MKKVDRGNSFLLFLIFFLTFTGYYVILLAFFSMGLNEISRQITIPIRAIVVLGLVVYFIRNRDSFNRYNNFIYSLFFLFVVCYFARILIDSNLAKEYYAAPSEVALYFSSFCVLPFLCISRPMIDEKGLKALFTSILYGGAIFSVLFLFSYSRFIGSVGRLASGSAGESVLSPLAVSYTSTLTIGVLSFYMLANKTTGFKMIFKLSVIAMSAVPFFLGASRGALIALFMPFLFYIFARRSFKVFMGGVTIVIIFVFFILYLDTALQSGLVDRFMGISEAVESGDSSASRIGIWKASFNQFLNNPIIGDRLAVDGWRGYAHNLFIEVMQTTGLLGFIPFLLLLINALKIAYYIFKHHIKYAWIAVIFIQAFSQHMFSGAVYTASWLWTSMGVMFAVEVFLKREGRKVNNFL